MKLRMIQNFLLVTALFTANAFADSTGQGPTVQAPTAGDVWAERVISNVSEYGNGAFGSALTTLPTHQHADVGSWDPFARSANGDFLPIPGMEASSMFPGVPKFRNGGSAAFNNPDLFNSPFGSYGLNIRQTTNIADWNNQIRSIRPFEIDISNPTTVYTCSIEPEDELALLAQASNWSGCYADRRSFVTEPNAPDQELLTRDLEVCRCLRSSPVSAVQEIMSQNFAGNRGNTTNFSNRVRTSMNAHWQENPEELNDVYSDTMNSFVFQANVVSRGEDPLFVGIMSQNIFGDPEPGIPVFQPNDNGHSLNPRRTDNFALLRDEAYPPGQCLSPMEFLALKQLPIDQTDGPLIKKDLGKVPFNPDDWDYNKLQSQYNEIMGKSIGQRAQRRDEILKLKAKLKYLNRNPMIKYIMGASAADLDILANSSDKMDEISEVFNSTNFTDLKSEMYSIMSMVKGNCNSACVENYHSTLKSFFDEDNRILLASLEAHKDSLRKMNNKVNVTDYITSGSATPTQRNIVNEFRASYGMRSPDECNAGSSLSASDAIGCLDIYSAYCRTLDKYEPQIQSISNVDPALLDNLDQLMADDLNTDINTNEEFAELNNAVCNTPRDGGILNLGGEYTFFTFKDRECSRNPVPQCDLASPEDYDYFRQAFDKFRAPSNKNMGEDILALYSGIDTIGKNQMEETELDEVRTAGSIGQSGRDPFTNVRKYVEKNRRRRPVSQPFENLPESKAAASMNSTSGNYAAVNNNRNNNNNETVEESTVNYSNFTAGATTTQTVSQTPTEPQTVQEMDQERREALMEDWEKEYATWKERYGSDKTPATVARDSQFRTEISTLRALLDQQKQISDQQYKLLNDAIAARTRLEQENLQRDQERERSVVAAERRSGSTGGVLRNTFEENIARGPASIADTQFNTSGVNGGGASTSSSSSSSNGASIGGSSSGNSAALGSSASSDSVAREEAKLVNLRRFSDGSIIIESSGNGSGSSMNAITVPVSDEQYRILQTNPQGLNLSQIESSIPREQISQLEKNGEIILLLRNGQNPPFEVKVEKKDNRLVYSLRDSEGGNAVPIRRVHLRSSLENLTKQFTNPSN